jgi:hypothetical protein
MAKSRNTPGTEDDAHVALFLDAMFWMKENKNGVTLQFFATVVIISIGCFETLGCFFFHNCL